MSQDLLVIVPGVAGSRLRSADREVWNLSAAAVARGLVHTIAALEDMELPEWLGDEPPDPAHALEPTGLITGFHVWPGFWAGAGYGRMLHQARRQDPAGARTVEFAYDWRLSNRYTASLLKERVEQALGRWREQPGQQDAKAVFVCHSMGGLIARYYVEVLGGAEITRRLITIGTPYSGSVKAVQALTGGLLGGVPGMGRISAKLTAVARGFPSVGQLLPTYRCVAGGAEPLQLADAAVPDLPGHLVADAMRLRREFERYVASGPGAGSSDRPPTHAIVGHLQPTWQSLSISDSGLTYHRSQRGSDFLGDGTVPRFSAIPAHWPDDGDALLLPVRHGSLQRDPAVLEAVWNKANALAPGRALGPQVELGLDLPEVAVAGQPFRVTVTADRADLLLYAMVEPVDGGSQIAQVQVVPTEPGCYEATLRAPAGLWQVRVEAVALLPPVSIDDVLLVV